MYMTYKMKAEELDGRFLRALKAMFKLTLSRLPCPLFGIDIAVVTFDKC